MADQARTTGEYIVLSPITNTTLRDLKLPAVLLCCWALHAAFAVPMEDLPCAPDDGDDVPRDRPRSAAHVETTHLQLLQEEKKKFGATRTKHICGAYRVEVREGGLQAATTLSTKLCAGQGQVIVTAVPQLSST